VTTTVGRKLDDQDFGWMANSPTPLTTHKGEPMMLFGGSIQNWKVIASPAVAEHGAATVAAAVTASK